MQSLSSYLSATLPRVLQTARRNAGKITLITLSTAGAVALAHYIHKTNTHIASTLSTERRAGADRLRAQFVATRPSLTTAFRAIHSTVLGALQSHELSNPDAYLARLREGRPTREEKTSLWRDVVLASMTRVCACAVLAGATFVALSLEIELLARYAGQDADSGVAAAPKAVGAETRAQFIECVRDGATGGLDELLRRVRGGVEAGFGDVGLTKRVGKEDMRRLVAEVVAEVDVAGLVTGWFADGGEVAEVVGFLKNEALDLCDVLDVEEVTERAVGVCVKELTNGVEEGPLVSGLARLVAECEKDFAEILVDDSGLAEFGACVFLSGERGR